MESSVAPWAAALAADDGQASNVTTPADNMNIALRRRILLTDPKYKFDTDCPSGNIHVRLTIVGRSSQYTSIDVFGISKFLFAISVLPSARRTKRSQENDAIDQFDVPIVRADHRNLLFWATSRSAERPRSDSDSDLHPLFSIDSIYIVVLRTTQSLGHRTRHEYGLLEGASAGTPGTVFR